MLAKLVYGIAGLAIVTGSFSATLFALQRWSGDPGADPIFTGSILTSSDDAKPTTLAELPKPTEFNWYAVRGLNVRASSETSAVAGQPVLQLITTSNETGHSLVAQYHGLNKNQVYRVTAWVRPEAGGNVEMEALDRPDGTPINRGLVIFDLPHMAALNTTGVRARGIEQGPGDWEKVWLDLATSDGQFLVAVRPTRGGLDSFTGDGRLGVALGGIRVAPPG